MRYTGSKKIAISFVIILSSAVQILAWDNFGTVQWVPDCGRLCFVSRVDSGSGIPRSVLFAGANFTFVYVWDYRDMTDMPATLYFDIGFLGWTAHNVTIDVGGGWNRFTLFAPLRTSTVEHDGKLVGVGTADTVLMWGRLVFLVSV